MRLIDEENTLHLKRREGCIVVCSLLERVSREVEDLYEVEIKRGYQNKSNEELWAKVGFSCFIREAAYL